MGTPLRLPLLLLWLVKVGRNLEGEEDEKEGEEDEKGGEEYVFLAQSVSEMDAADPTTQNHAK